MTALLPCPFCGCTKVELKDYGDAVCLHSVWCPDCDQHGPTSEVESTCAALWNLRAPIAVDDAMVERAFHAYARCEKDEQASMRAALEAAIGGGK